MKQTISEDERIAYGCKYYNNGVCMAHNNTKCLNTLFSVRNGYQKPNCPDYKPINE